MSTGKDEWRIFTKSDAMLVVVLCCLLALAYVARLEDRQRAREEAAFMRSYERK